MPAGLDLFLEFSYFGSQQEVLCWLAIYSLRFLLNSVAYTLQGKAFYCGLLSLTL